MKRTSVWCLFAHSHLGLAIFLPISPIELFGVPRSPWRTGPVRAPHSLVAFSGSYKECSEATLPSLTPRCADLFFLWARLGCAHVSFSLATHHLISWCLSWVMENHFPGPYALGLAAWMWEGSCYPYLCFVESSVFLPPLCWRGSDKACFAWVPTSPMCAVSGEPVEHFNCLFEWCCLCWLLFSFL